MALTGTISANVNIRDEQTLGVAGTQNVGCSKTYSVTLTDGAGASQAQKVYHRTRTIGGAPDDLDPVGSLTDVLGTTLTMAEMKGLAIYNNSTTNSITVGGDANQPTTFLSGTSAAFILPPESGCLFFTKNATGWALTASTGDIIQVTGTSGQTYDVIIWGN